MSGAGGCKVALLDLLVQVLVDEVRAIDPNRLVTASMAGNISPQAAAANHEFINANIVGFHDARTPDWSEQTDDRVALLRSETADAWPIYFSEPYPQSHAPSSWQADKWLLAVQRAKSAGAAAWCFHTQAFFYWSTTTPLSTVEWNFIKSMQAYLNVPWPR